MAPCSIKADAASRNSSSTAWLAANLWGSSRSGLIASRDYAPASRPANINVGTIIISEVINAKR
jgi:hypothetical protein